jgi:hypothetical protein
MASEEELLEKGREIQQKLWGPRAGIPAAVAALKAAAEVFPTE